MSHPGFTCLFLPIPGRKYLIKAPKHGLIHALEATFLNGQNFNDLS